MTGNEKLALDLFSGRNATYKVEEFKKEILPMIKALDIRHIQDEGKKFSQSLPAERGREVRDALNAWVKLKKEENKNLREQNFPLVETIMQYLGWTRLWKPNKYCASIPNRICTLARHG